MNLENKKSLENVKKAFALESQAIVKYLLFADIARSEGLENEAILFEKMSNNEKEHSKIWYKLIKKEFDNTLINLQNSTNDENFEWKNVYSKYAKEARDEDLEELAIMFERIASIEYDHERRFFESSLKLINKENNNLNNNKKEEKFFCIFCGFGSDSKLKICPCCGTADAFEN